MPEEEQGQAGSRRMSRPYFRAGCVRESKLSARRLLARGEEGEAAVDAEGVEAGVRLWKEERAERSFGPCSANAAAAARAASGRTSRRTEGRAHAPSSKRRSARSAANRGTCGASSGSAGVSATCVCCCALSSSFSSGMGSASASRVASASCGMGDMIAGDAAGGDIIGDSSWSGVSSSTRPIRTFSGG